MVPLHAYPVAGGPPLPKRLDFGKCALGRTYVKVVPLGCDAPVQFEFRASMYPPVPEFTVEPTSGTLTGGQVTILTGEGRRMRWWLWMSDWDGVSPVTRVCGTSSGDSRWSSFSVLHYTESPPRASIPTPPPPAVTYTPTALSTAATTLEIVTSELGSQPRRVALAGSATPGGAAELALSIEMGRLGLGAGTEAAGASWGGTAEEGMTGTRGGRGAGGGAGGGDAYTRLTKAVRERRALQRALETGRPAPIELRLPRPRAPTAEREVDGVWMPDDSRALSVQHTVNVVVGQKLGKLRLKVGTAFPGLHEGHARHHTCSHIDTLRCPDQDMQLLS